MEGSQNLKKAFIEFQQFQDDQSHSGSDEEAPTNLRQNTDNNLDLQQILSQQRLEYLEDFDTYTPDSIEEIKRGLQQQQVNGQNNRQDQIIQQDYLRQNDDDENDEDQFQFDDYINQDNNIYMNDGYQQQLIHQTSQLYNQQIDSERSNFTQESCSPPESHRDKNINNQFKNSEYLSQPLNIEDLTHKLEQISSMKKRETSLLQQQQDEISPNMNSDNFTLMHNSPGKESLLYSFQGHQTSNFPQNLQVSSMMKLREVPTNNDNNDQQLFLKHKNSIGEQQNYNQNSDKEEEDKDETGIYKNQQQIDSQESKKTSGFTGSFYKFEGQKIKEFEKSTLIKFEEFEGGDSQTESDPNRKYSERISDRIYERQDFGQNSKHAQSFDENQQIQESQSSNSRQQTYQDSPFNKDRQLPLFIITEEDQSEIQSSYQTYQRLQSMNSSNIEKQINQVNIGNSEFLRIHSGDQHTYQQQQQLQQYFYPSSREQNQNIYHKSKSQPIGHKKNSFKSSSNRNSYVDSKNETKVEKILNTDTSPMGSLNLNNKNQFSPNFKEKHKQGRISTQSPIGGNYDQDQISQYFNNKMGNKSQNPNQSQPEFIMSDEDLLSNIDRVSKILPTNEISEDEIQQPLSKYEEINLAQKLKEYKQMIEHLKCENQNKQILISIKESQLNLIQHKNEQLEDQIQELSEQLKNQGTRPQITKKQEMGTQVQIEDFNQSSGKKKIRPKKGKQSFSGLKKTPQRSPNDQIFDSNNAISANGNQLSKQNSTTNVFDTPQVRLDNMLRESPQSAPRNPPLQKHYSISFNSEDINYFKQQVVLIKQQLQRSEENNLTFQMKIEKQKNDKEKQKEKVLHLSIEKNDLLKQVDQFTQEIDNYYKKCEAMKVEIAEYQRHVENLEMRINSQAIKVDRDVQVFFRPQKSDQQVQVDYNRIISPKKSMPGNEEKDVQVNTFDDKDLQQQQINYPTMQQLAQNNMNHQITIINNKNDLKQLLGKARDYEQMSLQLQNEINDHRKMLRDNQERAQKVHTEHQDYKRKIKKREGKILKLKTIVSKLEKELKDARQKVTESQNKVQDIRLKMEGKIQEKEFKLISLKNQMKQFSQQYNQQQQQKQQQQQISSGIMTPSLAGQQNSKMISQKELFNMINQIIQKQISDQDSSSVVSKRFETLVKNRPKSQDHQLPNVMSFNENDNDTPLTGMYEEPHIVNRASQNVIYTGQGENPSFSNNGNLDLYQSSMKNENFQSPGISAPTQQQIIYHDSIQDKNGQKKSFAYSQNEKIENTHEFQQIFNSSLKRINQELENIKEVSSNPQQALQLERQKLILSNNNHKLPKKPANYSQVKAKSQNLIYNYIPDELRRDITYEDSLQSHFLERETLQNHILHIENQDSQSDVSNVLIEQLKLLEKRRGDSSENQETYDRRSAQNYDQQRKTASMQNTQTFRKPQSIAIQATQSNLQVPPQRSLFQDYHIFNNTQGNFEKEQNTSIFYDFKPAFENSNVSNSSNLNNILQNQDRSKSFSKNPQLEPTKYESIQNSINNSFRVPVTTTMASQVKLHSNLLQREKNINNLNNSGKSEVIEYNDESHDSITQRLANQIKKNSMTPTTLSQTNQHARMSQPNTQRVGNAGIIVSQRKEPPKDYKLSSNIRYEDLRGRYDKHVSSKSYVSNQNVQYIMNQIKPDNNIAHLRNIQVSNQQFLANLHTSQTCEGSKSTLSNYSQKLEDLKRRYGRLN